MRDVWSWDGVNMSTFAYAMSKPVGMVCAAQQDSLNTALKWREDARHLDQREIKQFETCVDYISMG